MTSDSILNTATLLSILNNAGFRRFIARASERMDSKVREHTRWEKHMLSSSVADPGCLYRIPDLKFSIQDPGMFRTYLFQNTIKYFIYKH
jgi:hypothetical protein